MASTICESVQGQDKLQGSRSIGEVGVGECGQEKMHPEGRGEGWEMLVWIGPQTRGIWTLRSGKRFVNADDSGREEEEKGLKATSAVLMASITFA